MSFANVSYEEAMRRAREIVPVLRSRAQKCEEARVLLRENEALLHETGLFRYHQPKVFGGMELPFVAVVDIVAELARGCPSTAWNVGNLGCHHWILAYYEPETQQEIWGRNPDVLIASSIALAAGRGRKVRDGFVVSGKWPFSSGVDSCDWNMLAVTIYEDDKAVDWRLCIVPKSDYRIIDTWYAMGMVGTGSKDIEVGEVFVPERRALSLHQRPAQDLARRRLWKSVHELDAADLLVWRYSFGHESHQVVGGCLRSGDHERLWNLAGRVMGAGDHGCVGHGRVGAEDRLQLGRGHLIGLVLDDLLHAVDEVKVAVLVGVADVAGA